MKIKKIRYGTIDITRSHFLIYFNPDPGGDPSIRQPIAILSSADFVSNMRLELLTHNINDMLSLELMHKELNYYLFELKNRDNIEYLKYSCSTISNLFYSKIVFNYIEKIDSNNILYYFITRSKQIGIYNNLSVTEMQKRYVKITVERIFGVALEKSSKSDAINYNNDLYAFFELVFHKTPLANNFEINDPFTIIVFSKWLSRLNISEITNILNFLKKINLVNNFDIDIFLKLYHSNSKNYKCIQACT